MAITFDLFDTLVAVDGPDDPASAVAAGLRERGIAVPDDWGERYRRPHREVAPGREYSLVAHVEAALESAGVSPQADAVESAVGAAFDPEPVETRAGAADALAAASDRGPVGLLSNCSVPGLVERCLDRSDLDRSAFDAVVTSVGCGWRKPDERAFEAAADRLGVASADLVHVGDDPETDGGASAVGARAVLLSEVPLSRLPAHLEDLP